MADANQLKRIEPIDYGQDDPFAELTRIMGFDPRVPVRPAPANESRQAAVTPAVPAGPAAASHDDFGFDIDLERELLGGLLPDDDAPVFAAPAAPAASHARRAPESFTADLDQEFDTAFAMDVGELDLELDLDAADAANDDIAFDFDEPAARDVAEPVMEGLPMAADERDDDLALGATSGEAAPAETTAVARGPVDEDFDFGFDVAMAQVDMDFDTVDSTQAQAAAEEPDLDLFDGEAFEQALDLGPETAGGEEVAVFAAEEEPTDAVEGDSAYAVEEEPVYAVAGRPAEVVALTPVEQPVSSVPPVMHEDTVLEDELAALLGNPVAPVELPGSYDSEPLTAALAVPAATENDIAGSADDFAGYEAELAAWQPEDAADGAYDAVDPAAFDDAADAEEYAPEAQYRADDGSYYGDDEAANPEAVSAEEPGLETGAYADSYDTAAFDTGRGEPAAEETVVDPLAALRSMTTDSGQGSISPAYPGYRSLATPTASPSFAAAQSAYQYPAAVQSYSVPAARSPAVPAAADPLDSYDLGTVDDVQIAGTDDGVPEIDTIDVPEHAFAVADDLDLPELAFAVDDAPARGYDDFERDFAVAYAEPEAVDESNAAEAGDLADYADAAFDAQPIDVGPTSVSMAGAAGWSHASVDRHLEDMDLELDAAANAAFADLGDFGGDDIDERTSAPLPVETGRSDGARRGLMIAAIVGGVAVIGGIGAFALSYGDSSGSTVPVIVRADDAPVKVRPENPGGTVVPNQDNKVYQTVTGGVSAPTQEKLITTSEEPVDVAAETLQGPLPLNEDDVAIDQLLKSEDRVEPTADAAATGAAEEVAVVAPRKVRTMVVKPDGSLVPRDEIIEDAAVAEPQPGAEASAMEPATAPASAAATGAVPSVKAIEAAPAPVEPAKTKVAKAADAPKPADKPKVADAPKAVEKTRTASIPDAGPLAPSRPADQPVDVVGEVKPDQVAAAGATAAAGAWSVQIASQPNEEAAKSTYQDLSRRYANVIGGKGVTIVKAEISGKGTFYRVRVPASSRSDAIALCEQYKAAGGNCFVSK